MNPLETEAERQTGALICIHFLCDSKTTRTNAYVSIVSFYEDLSPRHYIASNNDIENERPTLKLPLQVSSHIKHNEKKNVHFFLILILISDIIFRQSAENIRARQPPEEFSVPAVTSLRGIALSGPVGSH